MQKVEGHKKKKARATENCCDCHGCEEMCPTGAIETYTFAELEKKFPDEYERLMDLERQEMQERRKEMDMAKKDAEAAAAREPDELERLARITELTAVPFAKALAVFLKEMQKQEEGCERSA